MGDLPDMIHRIPIKAVRDAERLAALRACAVSEENGLLTLERESDCYKAMFAIRSRSRGLGDTVAKITRAVGIKPCGGCKKRQAALNKLFPYSAAT